MDMTSGFTQTELGTVPADWRVVDYVSFGQVIDGDRGFQYPGAGELRDRGHCLFLNAGNVTRNGFRFAECQFISAEKDKRLNKGKLVRGDVVLTTRGTVGNFAFYDQAVPFKNLRINSGMVILRNVTPDISNIYQYLVLRSRVVESQLERQSFGSAQPQLTVKGVSTLKIPIPPTKAEQEAIAETLSDADDITGALEQLLVKKRHLKQGAMQELLTGRKRLPGFAEEWGVRRFGEIAQPRKERIDPKQSELRDFCVELEHVEQGTGCLIGHTATSQDSSLKTGFCEGDVLFGKLRAYLRKYWLASREGVCSTEIWALVAKHPLLIAPFLFQIVQTDRFIEAASSAYGTHMPRSDWNVMSNIELELPSVDEQAAIAKILSDMDAEIAALSAKLTKVRHLKRGMMQELLTGRIRLV